MGCASSKNKRKRQHLRDNFIVERQKCVQDDYQIIRQIGKGSIGIIYLAENKIPQYCDLQHSGHAPKRQYAIKEIDGAMIDHRAFDSLKTEVRLLKTLDHPFIIKFYGSYSHITGDREKLSVVMELCTGGTLDKFVPYDEATANILVANILEAVLYLHSNRVIHRDLKNENIMYASKDRNPNNIRVIDFGLANTFSRHQKLHERMGTIYTMSPEALQGDYDEKTDVWSIGVCTYHLLSGRRPFWGKSKDEIARKVRNGKYSLSGPQWENVSREAKTFIRCTMQFDPLLRCSPVEALKSPWLKRQTESRIVKLSKQDLGVLNIVKDSTAPVKEMQKLALYAIAHKARTEEISKLRELYLCIKKDKHGEISLSDMKQALGGEFSDEQIEAWFNRADIEKSGRINYTEFVASSLDSQARLSTEEIMEAFRIFDRDDSGYITADDLREALQTEEGDYIDMLIKEADENGDGQISFREFRDCLVKNKLTAPVSQSTVESSA